VVVVLNSGDGTVSLIDKATYREIRRFPVGKEPHHLMIGPDGRDLYVANSASNELVILDPSTGDIRRRITGISDPYQLGFSPDKQWFVAASLRLDRVDIYRADGFKLVKRLPMPRMPSHMAFTADSSTVFVTLQDTNELVAINLPRQEVLWKMPAGKTPAGVYMTPDQKYLLVGVMGADYVNVIDWRARKSVMKIHTGKGCHQFLPLGDKVHVFVSSRIDSQIDKLNFLTMKVEATYKVPGGPDCMELSKDGSELWVTSRFISKVTVLDMPGGTIKKVIRVGYSPHGVYFQNHAEVN
jgi:YVTN family beta-propeller protein